MMGASRFHCGGRIVATDWTKNVSAKNEKDGIAAVEALIKKLPAKEVREPRTPTSRLVAEALRIARRVEGDEGELLKRSRYTKSEGVLLEVLQERFAEASKDVFSASAPNLPSKQKKLRDAVEGQLREVWDSLGYIADDDDDADLAAKVTALREGDSLEDTVEDLRFTLPLLSQHGAALKELDVDVKGLTRDFTAAHQKLAAALKDETSEETYAARKDRRDRLGLLLESHLARLRRHGREAFKAEPKKKAQYVDTYKAQTKGKTVVQPE
jgi:hypothetical protein